MFPALDTISVFPLIANTLGNNLYAAAGARSIKRVARNIVGYRAWREGDPADVYSSNERYDALSVDERKEALQAASNICSIFWRLVSAIPPLIMSMVATELAFSLLLAGVAGIHVAFLAPSLLQLRSSRLSEGRTVYSGWYSTTLLCYPVLLFATFSLVMVLLQIRDALSTGMS
jgi:hypothetical protein